MNARSGGRKPNSLGLQGEALEAILDQLDRATPEKATAIRRFQRLPLRLPTVHLKHRQAGSQGVIIRVACRDISKGGMSIVHNAYIHPGSPCALVLTHQRHGPEVVQGRIVRCQHRGGMLHELGIQFDRPIDVEDYLPTEPVEPAEAHPLRGVALVLHEQEDLANKLRRLLAGTEVRVNWARTLDEAVQCLHGRCEWMLMPERPGGQGPAEFIDRVRAVRSDVPVLVLAEEGRTPERSEAMAAGASGWITRPLERERLLRTLASCAAHASPESARAA